MCGQLVCVAHSDAGLCVPCGSVSPITSPPVSPGGQRRTREEATAKSKRRVGVRLSQAVGTPTGAEPTPASAALVAAKEAESLVTPTPDVQVLLELYQNGFMTEEEYRVRLGQLSPAERLPPCINCGEELTASEVLPADLSSVRPAAST